MDEIDRKILAALQADAGMSHTALAEAVGASPTSCWRRVRALEAEGILLNPVRLVDAAQVGLGVSVMLQVRMKSHAPAARQDFEAFVRRQPQIMECYSMSGEWDYQLRVVAADVMAYERLLMQQVLSHPNVAASASHFALSRVKYTTAVPV